MSRGGGAEQQNETANSGVPIDFDPYDDTVVKVHYDLSAWTFEQQAELSEAMAEAVVPHAWVATELVVPEVVEEQMDELFERLEQVFGPFPIGLDEDEPSTEFGLDEWSDADRAVLTDALVASEVPHRWEGTTVIVAADAEDAVDDLLDAIESGELLSADDSGEHEPPDGALGTIFLAADKLAKDPLDAKARGTLIELHDAIDARHPPYAFAPRTWASAVEGVEAMVQRFVADASGAVSKDDDDVVASDVIGLAQELRSLLRPYV